MAKLPCEVVPARRIEFPSSPYLPFSTLLCVVVFFPTGRVCFLLRKRLYPPSICEHVCIRFLSHNFSLWANWWGHTEAQAFQAVTSTCCEDYGCSCFGWKHWYTCLMPWPAPSSLLTHWLVDLKISLPTHLAGCNILALFLRTENKL